MVKVKTEWYATNRPNASGSYLMKDTSLWEILRFVAYWMKDHDGPITIGKVK